MSVRVTLDEGRRLLTAMGYRNPGMPEKIASRLNNLNQLSAADYSRPTDPEDARLFDKILGALGDNKKIELVVGEGAPPEEAPRKRRPSHSESQKKTKTPHPKTDKFGCRLGGEPARINAALRRTPQTAEEIGGKVGLSADRVNWQLNWYRRNKGFVEKTDKGAWRLVEGWEPKVK